MTPSMDRIKKAYLDRQADQERKLLFYEMPPLRFQASSLGKCKREQAYRLLGFIPKVFGARGMDYSKDGDMHHDATRVWMRDIGMKLDGLKFNKDGTVEETEAHYAHVDTPDGRVTVSMRLDGRVKLGRTWHVLELKSLGWGKMKGMREMWERTCSQSAVLGWIKENRRDMLYQVHACMYGSGLRNAYLVPKDRSECAVGLHSYRDPEQIAGGIVVPWDESVWRQIIARCQVVLRSVKAVMHAGLDLSLLPRPEFLASSKDCKQCNFRHLCHDADKRAKKGMEPAMLHPTLGEKIHVKDL